MQNLTVIKTFSKPWKIAGIEATDIEVREPTLRDMREAEKDAVPGVQPVSYAAALLCQVLVRAGSFTGPFVIGQLDNLSPKQYAVMRDALSEAEKLGEF